MKKIILLVMGSLILTSCTNIGGPKVDYNVFVEEASYNYTKGETTYVSDSMKETIDEINNLREKYKDSLDEDEFGSIYIDIYDSYNPAQDIFTLNNIYRYNEDYFHDIVEILDKREAVGLKDYISKAYNMDLGLNDQFVKKIGRSVVHVENRGRSKSNYIAIKVKLTDIKDKDYKDLFHNISKDKYILDKVYSEGQSDLPAPDPLSRDLINFVNSELFINPMDSQSVKIRYELLLKEKEINKVNILLSRRNKEKLKKEDIEVFINLLNTLDIKEEGKGKLLEAYRNVFEEKITGKDLNIEGYSIYAKYNKGNNYIGEKKENIYLSIEKD